MIKNEDDLNTIKKLENISKSYKSELDLLGIKYLKLKKENIKLKKSYDVLREVADWIFQFKKKVSLTDNIYYELTELEKKIKKGL